MSEAIAWMLELDVRPGKLDELRALIDEMVSGTKQAEPGALSYEWSLSSDGTRCHIYEKYADSAATLTHLGNFGERYAARFMGALTPTRLVVYGAPSDAVKQALAALNPSFMDSVAGFTR